MRKISNEFYPGELTKMILGEGGGGGGLDVASKMVQFFQVSIHFHPCHPQQQTTGNSFSAVR